MERIKEVVDGMNHNAFARCFTKGLHRFCIVLGVDIMKYKIFAHSPTATVLALTMMIGPIALFMTGTVFAHGNVDQSNPVGAGGSQILAHMPVGQEFTPSQPILVAVDVNLGLAIDEGVDTLTVNIRQGTITSPVLATTSQVVAPCPNIPPFSCGLVHFDFPAPLLVSPGDTYVLEVQATNETHAWTRADGGYSGGAAILQGVVEPALDFSFQTYSQAVMEVPIDIKPGSFPNSINLRSRGKIPVAILTTGTFDATTVDPTTVLFGQTGTEAAPVRAALEDVDGDGDTDMILHFNTM